jgi:hypothetical protein
MITPDDLADCQEDQLSAMWDRCIIRQPDSWQDEILAEGTVAWKWLGHDEIPCRVAVDDTQPRTVVIGGETVMVTNIVVTVPVSICPTDGQVITILSSLADPHLAGSRFDVKKAEPSTFLTARRVRCMEHR